MAQKIVSFEVAKALKEAGYPQDKSYPYWSTNMVIPTYLDAWLWLWRKKRVGVSVDYYKDIDIWESDAVPFTEIIFFDCCTDPEEAIASAIDYLVENNLIT